MQALCEVCNEEFYKRPSSNGKFCSSTCYGLSRRGKSRGARESTLIDKRCDRCNESFKTNREDAKFCSQRCYHNLTEIGKVCRQMTEVEAAWLAGLFDGEGSIVKVRRANDRIAYRLSLANTCKELLDYLHVVVGCGSISSANRRNKPERHADAWYWQCHGENTRNILTQMLPWLIVKKERALKAIGN